MTTSLRGSVGSDHCLPPLTQTLLKSGFAGCTAVAQAAEGSGEHQDAVDNAVQPAHSQQVGDSPSAGNSRVGGSPDTWAFSERRLCGLQDGGQVAGAGGQPDDAVDNAVRLAHGCADDEASLGHPQGPPCPCADVCMAAPCIKSAWIGA